MIIQLEGKDVALPDLPFGKVKKITDLYNKLGQCGTSVMTDEATGYMTEVLVLALGKSVEEVDAMTIKWSEVVAAMPRVAELCGLKMGPVTPGEALGVDGMNSTSTSSPVSLDGHGSTSTST